MGFNNLTPFLQLQSILINLGMASTEHRHFNLPWPVCILCAYFEFIKYPNAQSKSIPLICDLTQPSTPYRSQTHNMHIYTYGRWWKFSKTFFSVIRWKNQKCSESSETPRKVILSDFWKFAYFAYLCILCAYYEFIKYPNAQSKLIPLIRDLTQPSTPYCSLALRVPNLS